MKKILNLILFICISFFNLSSKSALVWKGTQVFFKNNTGHFCDLKINRAKWRKDHWILGIAPGAYVRYRGVPIKKAGASIAVVVYEDYDLKKLKDLKLNKEYGYHYVNASRDSLKKYSGGKNMLSSATYEGYIRTPWIKDKWVDVILKSRKSLEDRNLASIKVVQGKEGY